MEVNRSVREWVTPKRLEGPDTSTDIPGRMAGCAGVDLRLPDQLNGLARWKTAYSGLFRELQADPGINTQCNGKPFLRNGTYPTPGAEIYAAMILDFCPRGIVEVGAGFSTRIAQRAVGRLSDSCLITAVDPAPPTDVATDADEVVHRCVEGLLLDAFPLGERRLLFIDSSHVMRSGGAFRTCAKRSYPSSQRAPWSTSMAYSCHTTTRHSIRTGCTPKSTCCTPCWRTQTGTGSRPRHTG